MLVFAVRFEDHTRPEFVGMVALSASLSSATSLARIEADLPDVIAAGKARFDSSG